jgi:predicted dehydrogenase
MIKIGIVGLGFMSVAHIKGYRQLKDVEIVAVCNPSGRRLNGDLSDVSGNVGDQESIRLDMKQVTGYRDYAAFLEHPGMTVVDVCTPTRTHAGLCIQALEKGFNVICEKPLSRTLAEAETIAEAASDATGIFMPAMCLRFWPEWAWLKEAIDQNRFGKVQAAHFRRVAEAPGWGQSSYFDGTESGGALFDLHVHDVDFVQYCFGRPSSVYSSGFSKVSGAIDHVLTQYSFESGACVSAEGSWAMTRGFGFNMSYTAIFEDATIDYDMARGDDCLKLFSSEGNGGEVIRCQGMDGYAAELDYFLALVRDGRKPEKVTAADAIVTTAICEAEERSVISGDVVGL